LEAQCKKKNERAHTQTHTKGRQVKLGGRQAGSHKQANKQTQTNKYEIAEEEKRERKKKGGNGRKKKKYSKKLAAMMEDEEEHGRAAKSQGLYM